MQAIYDRAVEANEARNYPEAIAALIDAIKLLSQAQQQCMSDLDSANRYRTDIPIGTGKDSP